MVAKKLMKVLITGSTSTLGIALIRELDILNIEHIDITKEQANLENPTKFTKIIYEHKPTCIYHIGWYGSVTERESNEQFSINVPSTLEIFRTATEVKSNIVFIGSLAENDEYKSPYSIAKKLVEK
jgi:dTDP-4-dehydrorhamnose reductase